MFEVYGEESLKFALFKVPHNERLEFLGDAVVEFITSVHLFLMFPGSSNNTLPLHPSSSVSSGCISNDWKYYFQVGTIICSEKYRVPYQIQIQFLKIEIFLIKSA